MEPPTTIASITPEWLTGALRASGALDGGTVERIEVESLGERGGVNGDTARLRLTYRGQPGPPRIIAKAAAASPGARSVAGFQRWYERETRFYGELAGRTDHVAPRCHFAHFDAPASFLLLLDDLAPRLPGDQLEGITVEAAAAAVEALARLHARWWERIDEPATGWLPLTTVGLDRATPVQGAFARALEFLVPSLPAPVRAARERIAAAYPALLGRIARPPRTLVHGDYRADNLFLPEHASLDPVVAIDWQFICRARGTYDLAYFLALDLPPEERAGAEQMLLPRYLEALREYGIAGYDAEMLRDDYDTALLLSLAVFAIGALGEPAHERARRVHETGLARLCQAIVERDALRLVS